MAYIQRHLYIEFNVMQDTTVVIQVAIVLCKCTFHHIPLMSLRLFYELD